MLLVDDLEFEKNSDIKTILTAYYENKEKNIDYRLEVVLDDFYIRYFVNIKGCGTYGKAIKLTDEVKDKYRIEVPTLPLPF